MVVISYLRPRELAAFFVPHFPSFASFSISEPMTAPPLYGEQDGTRVHFHDVFSPLSLHCSRFAGSHTLVRFLVIVYIDILILFFVLGPWRPGRVSVHSVDSDRLEVLLAREDHEPGYA